MIALDRLRSRGTRAGVAQALRAAPASRGAEVQAGGVLDNDPAVLVLDGLAVVAAGAVVVVAGVVVAAGVVALAGVVVGAGVVLAGVVVGAAVVLVDVVFGAGRGLLDAPGATPGAAGLRRRVTGLCESLPGCELLTGRVVAVAAERPTAAPGGAEVGAADRLMACRCTRAATRIR